MKIESPLEVAAKSGRKQMEMGSRETRITLLARSWKFKDYGTIMGNRMHRSLSKSLYLQMIFSYLKDALISSKAA